MKDSVNASAYSPALRRWMVPDPLGEKYYGVNPYAYCNGDPVNYVDPEGRDIWEIDELGQLKYHTKDDNSDTFYIVDKNGNRTDKHISFDYGTIENSDSQYSDIDKKTFDWYTVRGDSNSEKLFKFFAENTSVEWSWLSMGIKGDLGLNLLSSSHESDTERAMTFLLKSQYISYSIRSHTHSHPNNLPYPSFGMGTNNEGGDISFAFWLAQEQRLASRRTPSFRIYLPRQHRYINYNYLSIPEDFGQDSYYLPSVTVTAL